jgi:hypothetical protein
VHAELRAVGEKVGHKGIARLPMGAERPAKGGVVIRSQARSANQASCAVHARQRVLFLIVSKLVKAP